MSGLFGSGMLARCKQNSKTLSLDFKAASALPDQFVTKLRIMCAVIDRASFPLLRFGLEDDLQQAGWGGANGDSAIDDTLAVD